MYSLFNGTKSVISRNDNTLMRQKYPWKPLSTVEHKRRLIDECFHFSCHYNWSQWGPKQHWTTL